MVLEVDVPLVLIIREPLLEVPATKLGALGHTWLQLNLIRQGDAILGISHAENNFILFSIIYSLDFKPRAKTKN